MRKYITIVAITVLGLSSCKKTTTTPNSNNSNNTTSLPEQYVSINDGTTSYTVSGYGNIYANMYQDTNNTTLIEASSYLVSNPQPKIVLNMLLPSDTIRISSFKLGTYGTTIFTSNSFNIKKVKNGSIALQVQFNKSEAPYISYVDDANATNSYNKITSIKRIESKWDGLMTVVYSIEGEFKISVQQEGTNATKNITGKYRYRVRNSI